MAQESPFFLTKVECPVCKTINEFENIKVGSYVEEDHDTDFCPQGRQWRNPKYEIYNPLLFFMATCENCFYTREFNQGFKDWKNDVAFRSYRLKTIRSRHLEALAIDGSVLKMLGQSRDAQLNPFATAVAKFLLGVYDELLVEHPRKLDIGRFFLRIAWLYREHYGSESVVLNEGAHFAHDIEKAYSKLKQARDYFNLNVESMSKLIEEAFSDQATVNPTDSEFLSLHHGFQEQLQKLRSVHGEMSSAVNELSHTVQTNSKLRLDHPMSSGSGSIAYAGFASFEDFIREAKTRWEYVPLSEQEALLYAAEFYKGALEEGHEIQQGNQQIQALYLIAELSRRVGRHKEAKLYFNNTIKAGQQYVFDNRGDQTRTALARKVLDLAVTQGKKNLKAVEGK